jgi:hypothetical protein
MTTSISEIEMSVDEGSPEFGGMTGRHVSAASWLA